MVGINKVSLNVKDQDGAKAFWIEKMGFTEVLDQPMGDDAGAPRWIEVRSPDDHVELVLFAPEFDESKLGQLNNVLFSCEDLHQTHKDLVAKGVEFGDEPRLEFWGDWWSTFSDNEGNFYGLTQPGPRE